MIQCFPRAVALYAAARCTNSRNYRREARRLAKKIERWLKVGNPNVVSYQWFLTAEQFALDKKYDMAEQKYKEAIDLMTREDHLHRMGLLNERYADFLMEVRSQKDKSKAMLKEAIRYYADRGSMRKVKLFESRL